MNPLKLFGDYLNERYENQSLVEVKDGFFTYEINEFDGIKEMHIHHFYVVPKKRGVSSDVAKASVDKKNRNDSEIVSEYDVESNKSLTLKLFLKLEDIARKKNCKAITCICWLNAHKGNDILKLYLNIGFTAVSGDGPMIRLRRFVSSGKR